MSGNFHTNARGRVQNGALSTLWVRNCLSSTLLRQQTPFLQKERDCVRSTALEPTENACLQGPGAHLSARIQGLDQRV